MGLGMAGPTRGWGDLWVMGSWGLGPEEPGAGRARLGGHPGAPGG